MTEKTVPLKQAIKALHHAYDLADDVVKVMRQLLEVDAEGGNLVPLLDRRLAEVAEHVRSDRANTISKLKRGELR